MGIYKSLGFFFFFFFWENKYLVWLGWTMKCYGNIEFWIVFVNLGTFVLSGCWGIVWGIDKVVFIYGFWEVCLIELI